MTVSRIVYDFLDNMEDGFEISGWTLTDEINSRSGRHTYPSTLLGYCRDYCDIVGGEWECIDNQKSIYRFHKGKITLGKFSGCGRE
jgi:hypothetical protein